MPLPETPSEPCAYRVEVKAAGFHLTLDGQSGTETWVSPAGERVPSFWEESQSMRRIACPGPRMDATVSIRQPISNGVRQERASRIEIDANFTPDVGDSAQWRHAGLIDLSRPQTLTGNGFTVTVEPRPN